MQEPLVPRFMTQRKIARYRDHAGSYSLIDPHGRRHVICPQCRTVVLLCDHLSAERRREIAQAYRGAAGLTVAWRLLETRLPQTYGFDDQARKGIILHIPRRLFHCENCGQEHPEGALLCAQCMGGQPALVTGNLSRGLSGQSSRTARA